jgi:hypothetical protein
MADDTGSSLTQAGAVLITSVITYMLLLLTLGPFIDMWIFDVAGILPVGPWGQVQMAKILVVGTWIYRLIEFCIVFSFFWFFIFIIKRHRYTRQPGEWDVYNK